MVEVSIQVDPEGLRSAQAQLRQLHESLSEAVSAIDGANKGLDDAWTGAAADFASTKWQELHPRLAKHAEVLAGHAEGLLSDLNAVTGQDEASAEDFRAQQTRLKI